MEILKEISDVIYNTNDGLLHELHIGNGVNNDSLQRLYIALEKLKKSWAKSNSVDKELVLIVSLIAPTVALMSYHYDDPEENYNVRLLAHNLLLAVESCASPQGSGNSLYNMPLNDIYCEPPGPEIYVNKGGDT